MLTVRETDEFANWLGRLRDYRAKARILRRVDRLIAGNAGDVRPVGEGISELRIDYGPGYRVYFLRRGTLLIILLCGGDKRTQDRDIRKSKELANKIRSSGHVC
ncbi:MAG: type II toxin-antitoxin system RelE/ParE family toxin [Hyphomicrobiales bacterium]|nr:type II toxin-antitoxin system RelE/ParE family toxin [Hyphomicrobiales bacterium]MBV9054795.1 type II toxin-antitoxin system RelE/ParE family toxin [Hyphomicrobiales bacterium]MBV9135797.1 type II toxin-antitoxin system RelE/ParE family toxin [Hyphomicrobiales bacterium]MBV9973986.1 type II toxin-antitoxin system RelE/ParE family toxin [Hyphomicrobiales bacterium]